MKNPKIYYTEYISTYFLQKQIIPPVSNRIGSKTSFINMYISFSYYLSYFIICTYTKHIPKFPEKKEPDASGSPRCNPKISTAILIYNIQYLHKICKNFMAYLCTTYVFL